MKAASPSSPMFCQNEGETKVVNLVNQTAESEFFYCCKGTARLFEIYVFWHSQFMSISKNHKVVFL